MLAYTYDGNGYLNGITTCQPNPRKANEFLTPANSTTTAPPTVSANNIAKWDGSSWNEVEDPSYTAAQVQAAAEAAYAAAEQADKDAKAAETAENELALTEDAKQDELQERNQWGILLKEEDSEGNIVPKDQSTIDSESEVAAAALLRSKRNGKLFSCDYTQITDSPLSEQQRADWAAYRQELRDLPANTPDPKAPVWPEEPS